MFGLDLHGIYVRAAIKAMLPPAAIARDRGPYPRRTGREQRRHGQG